MPDNEIINSTGINDDVPPTDNDNPTENGTDIPVDDDNPIENSTETPDESESADMTDNGAELPDEDEKMPIIFPDNGLEDDFPDEVSADELESEPEQKPESESKQEPQPVELTEEQTEQPEEQAKKKLWDTIREGLSDFTKRFKREQAVKAEVVKSQSQGIEPVSEEKVSEEKQLTPAERIKVDACTAIMMAHLKGHSISYTPETVKRIVQSALTSYAAALGSDRLLGGFRDASTTKRLISDVMSGITTDIQKEFGEQPIKVTVTASFGREEMRTIAKQMYSVLKIPNDDDHLGNSIRTTLDEIPNIKVPLTVSYMEALEERKKHETIIENNNTYISGLKKAIEDQKTSLNDIKEKFKAETGLDYDKITASKAPDAPDTNDIPDYSKILKPEYSELFEQCVLLSSNLNRLNTDLEDQNKADLPDIKDDDKKIRDMEEQLQKLGVSGITEFINKLNPPAVPSGEIPGPENQYIPKLNEVFDAVVEKYESVSHADSEPGTTPADTDGQNQDGATELPAPIPESFTTPDPNTTLEPEPAPADATPSDPTPEPAADGQSQNDGATTEQHEGNDNAQSEEKSDSDDLESAPATPPTDDKGQDGVAELPDPATPLDPTSAESASAAENQGQGQDDSETASATTDQPEVNDNAQGEKKSDSDDLKSAPATPPTDTDGQNQDGAAEQPASNKKTNTMFRQDGGIVNNAGSAAAAEEAARKAARKADAPANTDADGKKNDTGKKQNNGPKRKFG